MSRKFFGTDGIRGVAGAFPLDPPTVTALGLAAGQELAGRGAKALVAADTRESGPLLAERLMQGLEAAGVECHWAGVLPTPGVSYLSLAQQFTLGVVISASHNPWRDNGIKFFGPNGAKLADETEARIERQLERGLEQELLPESTPPRTRQAEPSFTEAYLAWLLAKWKGPRLHGWKVVLDCAHGAAYQVAPRLFEHLGAEVVALNCAPDGRNINEGCGSLHLDQLQAAVLREKAQLGLAFDGDADRCLAVTDQGKVLDGDYLLYHEALRRRLEGRLPGGWVVGTVMSNLWLEQALTRNKLRFYRAAVGDRYVLQCLMDRGGLVGGEPSGHILILDEVTSGDGLFTGMAFAMHARHYESSEALAAGITPFPQRLVNLKVQRRVSLEGCPSIQEALRAQEAALAGDGRVVLRFSGTEPLLRLMVEAKTESQVEETLARLSEVLYTELGKA